MYTSACVRSFVLASSQRTPAIRPNGCFRRWVSNTPRVRAEPAVPDKSASSEPKPTEDVNGEQVEIAGSSTKNIKPDQLPFLQRPLGVRNRPTTVPKTWREEMMDDETRRDHRDKLLKEATKGYFTDLNATRTLGGKTWIAPRVLIREDKALYFPDILGTPLNGNTKIHTADLLLGKVSIVCMLSSKISEYQTETFIKAAHNNHKKDPLYQLVYINLQENLLKSLLVSLFSNSIRKTVPPEQWGKYLISSQNMDYVREDLGMTNRHIGYVYLLDPACRIRWAGCADPKPEETHALEVCTKVLLSRQKRS